MHHDEMLRRFLLLACALAVITCGTASTSEHQVLSSEALGCADDHVLLDPDPSGPDPNSGARFGQVVRQLGDDVLVGTYVYSVPGAGWTGKVELFDGDSGAHIRTFSNPRP